ncbi:MAG: hypothetical protein DRQ47_07565 [Gammaproteobacteria bacterium]|nr:MAG: hypothetical protein DRQ47_07565 [Gammaproteobacteria bacterium]
MNLVMNAAEAIESNKGRIIINTSEIQIDSSFQSQTMNNQELQEGDYISIEISDTGCGMDEETQAKIFDPFFTTKFTGRGLGMSAVLGIVRGHNGAINVTSELGKGTIVTVLLPVARKALIQ